MMMKANQAALDAMKKRRKKEKLRQECLNKLEAMKPETDLILENINYCFDVPHKFAEDYSFRNFKTTLRFEIKGSIDLHYIEVVWDKGDEVPAVTAALLEAHDRGDLLPEDLFVFNNKYKDIAKEFVSLRKTVSEIEKELGIENGK